MSILVYIAVAIVVYFQIALVVIGWWSEDKYAPSRWQALAWPVMLATIVFSAPVAFGAWAHRLTRRVHHEITIRRIARWRRIQN